LPHLFVVYVGIWVYNLRVTVELGVHNGVVVVLELWVDDCVVDIIGWGWMLRVNFSKRFLSVRYGIYLEQRQLEKKLEVFIAIALSQAHTIGSTQRGSKSTEPSHEHNE
jgi:hypothetical protein